MSSLLNTLKPRLADWISFATLGAAIGSMALAVEGSLRPAAGLILLGYVLDGLDGEVARRMGGFSEFGTQLDSLIDVVHFGAANSILIAHHLEAEPLGGWPIWLLLTCYMFASCFRLARFNLSASAGNKQQTVGLTISTGGAFLAIVVLFNLAYEPQPLAGWAFLLLLAAISLLMISRIPFPDFKGLPHYRWPTLATFAAGGLVALRFRIEAGLLLVWGTYILFGTIRAAVRLVRPRSAGLESRPGSIDQRSSA